MADTDEKKLDQEIAEPAESDSVDKEELEDAASDVADEKETNEWEESFDKAQAVQGSEEPSGSRRDESREWELKYKRALADYQNLEKRVAEQRRELILSSSKEVILRLLPVLDTLHLAAKHLEDKGLAVSIQQFEDVLKAESVVKIETVGKKFDPSHMEAVGTAAGDEGKVVQEARAGYLMHEKLLRPAQVFVGAGKKIEE